MFSMNKVELDLISDVDMYLSFQKCMKGDVSYIFKRRSKANNKYLTSYDPKKQQNMLRTKNNLCCYAMSKSLLTNGFNWLNQAKYNLENYGENSSKNCV